MFNLPVFIVFCLASTYTPGVVNISCMSIAGRVGFSRCIGFIMGSFLGRIFSNFLCLFFSSTMFSFIPRIQFGMKVFGALYLLYLAWKNFKSTIGEAKKTFDTSFFSGLLLQITNPKAYIGSIVMMSSFIMPHFNDTLHMAGLTFMYVLVAVSSNFCWALFGSTFYKLLSNHRKVVNTILSLLLVYCAVSLFL